MSRASPPSGCCAWACSLPARASSKTAPKRLRISSSVASDLVNHRLCRARALALLGRSLPSQYSSTWARRGSRTGAAAEKSKAVMAMGFLLTGSRHKQCKSGLAHLKQELYPLINKQFHAQTIVNPFIDQRLQPSFHYFLGPAR